MNSIVSPVLVIVISPVAGVAGIIATAVFATLVLSYDEPLANI